MLNKPKYTPAPWHVNLGSCLDVFSYNDKLVATVYEELDDNGAPVLERYAEAEANARLIAAAPELLKACKETLHNMLATDTSIGDFYDLVEKLKAAIAKAEGK